MVTASSAQQRTASQLRAGQEIAFTSPQFVVTALWFKSNDETNWKYAGSDEVYAVFSDMDPTHYDHRTSVYGNVDEGDTVNFRPDDKCMAPQSTTRRDRCARGMAEINVRFSFWEDDPNPFSFCPGDLAGSHEQLTHGSCPADDLIGRGEIIYSAADLIAMLPDVGSSRETTFVMDKDAGTYRFRYRITRVADVERSIVIHLPPDPGLPATITLQATVDSSEVVRRVRLTWSGATTSSVDIYRNGAKLTTTTNDGMHTDPVSIGTYQYRVCNLGSTTACSAQVTAVVT
jgi:hypothetical protein